MLFLRPLLALLVVCSPAFAETIRVGAAISLKDAMQDIASDYESQSGDKVEFVFGSSGQIKAQISAGAVIDVFLSAAARQMDELDKEKLIVPESRQIIARNALVLIIPAAARAPASFAALAESSTTRIAIGEPKTVPAGQYAQQAFEHMKLSDRLADKLVYGTNVRQVLAYVERGEASAGVVYATDARQSEKVRVVASADPADHEPIVYPAALIAGGAHQAAGERFLKHLAGAKAQAALAARGFAAKDAPTSRPASP